MYALGPLIATVRFAQSEFTPSANHIGKSTVFNNVITQYAALSFCVGQIQCKFSVRFPTAFIFLHMGYLKKLTVISYEIKDPKCFKCFETFYKKEVI